MSTLNGKSYTNIKNVNLRGGALGSGLIRWSQYPAEVPGTNWATNPFASAEVGLYINSIGQLVFSYLGSSTVLGGTGPGGVPSWEQIFAGDQTFQLAGTTWTIDNNTGNNNILTLTNSGAGSGNVIQVTNVGTGKDINGTSNTWSVDKTGVAVFLSAQVTTNVIGSSGLTLSASGAGVVTIGANTNTVTIAKAATFSSTITVTNGLTDLGSTSNTAAALRITNNTATTLGAGVSDLGIAVIRSTSLTTGNALLIQLANGTVTTGYYINAWDSGGSTSVFKVAANGATTIAGSAFATAALTVSLGDIVVSSGKLLITAASNAASTVVFTNNTATSATVFAVAGSGVFTGSTTTSFVTITPSGLTTGTAVYIPLAALTTGIGINVPLNALTTGQGLILSHTTSVIADTGSLLRLSSTSNDTGGATNGTMFDLSSTAAVAATVVKIADSAITTGVLMNVSSSSTGLTSGAVMKVSSQTTGALTTNSGVLVATASGIFTSSAAGSAAIQFVGNATTAGTLVGVSATGLITGIAFRINAGIASLTTGSALVVTNSSAASNFATNGLALITHTGAYTSTSNVGLLNVVGNSTTTGTLTSMFGNALTTGVALFISGTGVYTGTGFVTITQSGATTGTIMLMTVAALTTGVGISIAANALTSGNGILVSSSSTDSTARGLIQLTNSGSGSTGTALVRGTQVVQSTNFRRIMTESGSGVTLWYGNGTTGQGNLSGTVGDILFNGGSNKPEYCTGTTNWTALV